MPNVDLEFVADDVRLAPEAGDDRQRPDLVVRWHKTQTRFTISRGWADPDPYPHREMLKAARWRWDPKEKAWYTYRATSVDALAATVRLELAVGVADALQARRDEDERNTILREAARVGGITDAMPPVVQHEGGLLVLTGIWSDGQRSYTYSTLQAAGYWPEEAARRGLAVRVTSARGAAVERWRDDADTSYDGTGYHLSGKESRVELWLVPEPDVPVQVKAGSTYRSSGHIRYGKATASHYNTSPATATAAGYRSASARYRREHGLPAPERNSTKKPGHEAGHGR